MSLKALPSTSLPSVINPEGAAKVFRGQGDSLKLVVQNDLTSVASKLYSKSIITADARKKAMNQMHLDSDRAVSLLGVVEDRIRDEPRVFTEFVKILESDTVTRSAADKLVKMYCQGSMSIQDAPRAPAVTNRPHSDLSRYLKLIPSSNHWKLEKELDWDNDINRDLIEISKHIIRWEVDLKVPLGLTRTDIYKIKQETEPSLRLEKVLSVWKGKQKPFEATYRNLLTCVVAGKDHVTAKKICELPIFHEPAAQKTSSKSGQDFHQSVGSSVPPQSPSQPQTLPLAHEDEHYEADTIPAEVTALGPHVGHTQTRAIGWSRACNFLHNRCPKFRILLALGILTAAAVFGTRAYLLPWMGWGRGVDCHEIHRADSSALEDYLSEIPDYSNNNMRICKKLSLSDCNELATAKNLTPFYLAERYLAQTAEPCWEDIVHMLCKDFKERNLAKRVADERMNGADYKQYCR